MWLARATREQRGHAPQAPRIAPRAPAFAPRTRFQEISALHPAIVVEPGTTYLGEIELPFLAGALVSRAALKAGLEREGFIVIRLDESRPPFWPRSEPGADWFAVVSYVGTSRPMDVPGAVTRAWTAEASS
jgi:hypothetical protein